MQSVTTIGRYLGLVEIAVRNRIHDDRGEGVISMAIAVLIIATIGAGLWFTFNTATTNLGTDIETQIGQVGGGG